MNTPPTPERQRRPFSGSAWTFTLILAMAAMAVPAPAAAQDLTCEGPTVVCLTDCLDLPCCDEHEGSLVCDLPCDQYNPSSDGLVCISPSCPYQGGGGSTVDVKVDGETHCFKVCQNRWNDGYGLYHNTQDRCYNQSEVGECPGAATGVFVGSDSYCVSTTACPAGYSGSVVNGQAACVRECDGATIGAEAYGGPSTCNPLIGSCTGSNNGLVVASQPACFRLCPSQTYGLVVNDDAECHWASLCPSGSYGVMVDANPSGCHYVAPCPSPKTGYMVDGNPATCVSPVTPPTVTPCPSGSYGVMVNGNPGTCATVTECAGDPIGYTVTPGGSTGCHTVETCPAGSVGVRVDGTGQCIGLPVEDCPPGRQGIVINGNEICPIAG